VNREASGDSIDYTESPQILGSEVEVLAQLVLASVFKTDVKRHESQETPCF